jgi:hypothetical protein
VVVSTTFDGCLQATLAATPNSLIVLILLLFFALSLPGLLIFHCRLIYNCTTTNEDFIPKESRPNYSRGVAGNVARVFCGPVPPTRLHARRPLRPDGSPWNWPIAFVETVRFWPARLLLCGIVGAARKPRNAGLNRRRCPFFLVLPRSALYREAAPAHAQQPRRNRCLGLLWVVVVFICLNSH